MVTLAQINSTVRRMTARYTTAQMSDIQINNYINLAYTIHFPEQFRTLKLNKPYIFTTIPNVDTYAFPYEANPVNNASGTPVAVSPGNITINPPVYCQGYRLGYYQDQSKFYDRWPKLTVNQQINTWDSLINLYTGTIPSTPFLRAQLDIFGNVTQAAVIISSFDDDGDNYTITDSPQPNSNIGILYDALGNNVGTVNYLTGAYSFAPIVAGVVDDGSTIYASVIPYMASRPTDVIFYNQLLTFRPVPMQVYQVEFQISQQPTALLTNDSAPELDEWYLFLCCIAAKLIYNDFPDPEGMAALMPIYQDQLQMAQRRTLRQLGNQRSQTIFTQGWRNSATYFDGSMYSGGF